MGPVAAGVDVVMLWGTVFLVQVAVSTFSDSDYTASFFAYVSPDSLGYSLHIDRSTGGVTQSWA